MALISAVLISVFLDKISAINGTNTPTTTITTTNLLKNVSSSENIAAINETELEKELTILDVKFYLSYSFECIIHLKIKVSIHRKYYV